MTETYHQDQPETSPVGEYVDWTQKTEAEKIQSTVDGIEALMSLLPDDVLEVLCTHQLSLVRNGAPRPAFVDVKEDARIWADHASPSEINFYAWHAFLRMSPDIQKRFAERVARETQGG